MSQHITALQYFEWNKT